MSSLIDKGKVADKISDLFLDNYPNPSEELETFYKEVLKIVVNEEFQPWVSVKDKLPKIGESVLVYGKNGISLVGAYWKWGWTTTGYCDVITHWMPLPSTEGLNNGT